MTRTLLLFALIFSLQACTAASPIGTDNTETGALRTAQMCNQDQTPC